MSRKRIGLVLAENRLDRFTAAVHWDITPLIIIGFMAARYVSRGIGETERLVPLGVGSALFWGWAFLVRRLGR